MLSYTFKLCAYLLLTSQQMWTTQIGRCELLIDQNYCYSTLWTCVLCFEPKICGLRNELPRHSSVSRMLFRKLYLTRYRTKLVKYSIPFFFILSSWVTVLNSLNSSTNTVSNLRRWVAMLSDRKIVLFRMFIVHVLLCQPYDFWCFTKPCTGISICPQMLWLKYCSKNGFLTSNRYRSLRL